MSTYINGSHNAKRNKWKDNKQLEPGLVAERDTARQEYDNER